MGPEEGHARWREQLEKALKRMQHSLACSESCEKLRMARDRSARGHAERRSISSAAPNAYLLWVFRLSLGDARRGCGRERTGDEKCVRAPYGVYHTASTPLQNVNKGYVENVQPGFCAWAPPCFKMFERKAKHSGNSI